MPSRTFWIGYALTGCILSGLFVIFMVMPNALLTGNNGEFVNADGSWTADMYGTLGGWFALELVAWTMIGSMLYSLLRATR